MVDTRALGARDESHGGSSPFVRTIVYNEYILEQH